MSLLPAFLTDSLDEIVFEGRNQAYGAYRLRLDYQRNLASAGGLTLGLCLLLLLSWAAWRQLAPVVVPMVATTRPIAPILVDVKPLVIAPPKLAVLAPPASRRAATHPTPIIPTQVTKDETPQPRPTPPAVADVVDGPVGPATPGPATPADLNELVGAPGGTAAGTAPAAAPAEPFTVVEKMPAFAGGQEALLRYLRNHLRYPSAALAAGVGGRVFMSFVVGSDGKISEVTILKGLGYGLDEEALRVVRQMPAWTPGYQSQHPVPVRFTLPITFQYQ